MAKKSNLLISCLLRILTALLEIKLAKHLAVHSLAMAVSWKTPSLVARWAKRSLFSTESSEGIYVWPPVLWHLQWPALAGMLFPRSFFLPVLLEDLPDPACRWLLMEKCLPGHLLVGTTYIKIQFADHPSSQTFINVQEEKKLCRKTISLNKILKEFPFHFS